MRLRLRLYLLILLIIGVLASFYFPGVLFSIGATVYADSPSPYNINWSGTSILYGKLRSMGLRVVIANTTDELINEIGKGGLFLIVAPDRLGLDNDTINRIVDSVYAGRMGVAVFDENITSNPLIGRFGLLIDGRSILDPEVPEAPQYPRAVIREEGGNVVYTRLNWASYAYVKSPTRPGVNFIVFASIYGVIDYNDNGKLDPIEESISPRSYPAGVAGLIDNRIGVFVFTDSFPVLNIALQRNYTLSSVMIDYIVNMSRSYNNRVIIANFMYKVKNISIKLPFHVSLLFLMMTYFMNKLDQFVDTVVFVNTFMKILVTLFVVIGIALIYRFLFRITGYADYESSTVDEVVFIAETPVTEAMIKGKYVSGEEKKFIVNYWNILYYAYEKVMNVKLDEVVDNKDELSRLAHSLGVEPRELEKSLRFLYNVYLKASGRAGLFPIIFSWRRTMLRYAEQTDKLLNFIGYTLTKKGGLKDVLYLVK